MKRYIAVALAVVLVLGVAASLIYANAASLTQAFTVTGNQTNANDCTGPSGSTVTISWNTICQTIDGFGSFNGGNSDSDIQPYWSLMFQTLGFSILRTQVNDDGSCTSVNSTCSLGGNGGPGTMQYCRDHGCINFATSWDPTAAYSTNGSIICSNGTGTLDPSHYQDFANYLSNYIASMQQYNGISLYAISPQNEPEVCDVGYKSSLWPGTTFDTFIKNYLGPTLSNNGQSSTLIIMPEPFTFSHLTTYADTCMGDSACAQYVKIIAFHDYGGWVQPSNTYSVGHVWMTETSLGGPCGSSFSCNADIGDALYWAGTIDNDVGVGNIHAWIWWLSAYNGGNDSSMLFNNGTVSKRAYTIGNYAKYVRPGYSHIAATHNPQGGVAVTAYRSAGGSFAIVAINTNGNSVNQSFSISGANPSSVTPTITSGSQSLQDLSSVAVSGGNFSYALPAQSIITFHNP